MKKNKHAMSIILAIILTIIMSLIAIYMINYIIPFSRNVKGIENVARAYYQAEKGIEESLYYVKNNFGTDFGKTFDSNKVIDDKINIIASGSILPLQGQGNSEFNKDYNRIRIGEPIQLKIGNGKLDESSCKNIKFTFKIPDIGTNVNSGSTLVGGTGAVINWQLITETASGMINANGSYILANDISGGGIIDEKIFNGTNKNSNGIEFDKGIDLNGNTGSDYNFAKFYDNHCGNGSGCVLKMSIINKLEVKDTVNSTTIPIPYLEWKIDLISTGKNIPLRYTQIHTEGKSYGFKKEIDVRIPQQTVNEAFDFTVFQ